MNRLPNKVDVRIEDMWSTVVNICRNAFPKEVTNANRSICRLFQGQIIVPLKSIPNYNWVELKKILRTLVTFLDDDGKYKEAEPLLHKIANICRHYQGTTHPDILSALSELAACYFEQGRYNEALPLQSFVFRVQKESLGPNSEATLRSMADLATIYGALGRDDIAIKLQKSAVEGMKLILGDNHSATLGVMSHLAISYGALGQLDEAKKIQIFLLNLRNAEKSQSDIIYYGPARYHVPSA